MKVSPLLLDEEIAGKKPIPFKKVEALPCFEALHPYPPHSETGEGFPLRLSAGNGLFSWL